MTQPNTSPQNNRRLGIKLILMGALCLGVFVIPTGKQANAVIVGSDTSVALTERLARSRLALVRKLHRASLSVARINFQSRTGHRWGSYNGTGFMVSDNLMLTNKHNITSSKLTRYAKAIFLDHKDRSRAQRATRPRTYSIRSIVTQGKHYDFSLVRLRNYPLTRSGTVPGRRFGILRLASFKPRVGMRLMTIGHPKGQPKRVSFKLCKVSQVQRFTFYHTCDTHPGSSGSPVVLFSNPFVVVGLHFAGVSRGLRSYNKAVRGDFLRGKLQRYIKRN